MLRVLRIAALACVAAFLASAASARDVSVGLQSPVTSMDPHYHNLSPNNSLLIHIFEPLVSRVAAHRRLVDELLGFFGGRMQPIVAHLVESGRLTPEDVQEAERTLRKFARKDKE